GRPGRGSAGAGRRRRRGRSSARHRASAPPIRRVSGSRSGGQRCRYRASRRANSTGCETAPARYPAPVQRYGPTPARRAISFWRGRPTLGAAAGYAVLAVLMVGQGLLPGRTLSGSDWALSSVPWQAAQPGSVPGLGTNFELADSADVFQPFLQYTRSRLPNAPLWKPY